MAFKVKAILLALFPLGKVKKDSVDFCTIAGLGHKVQRSGPASALVSMGCSNNMQLQPPPPPTMQI